VVLFCRVRAPARGASPEGELWYTMGMRNMGERKCLRPSRCADDGTAVLSSDGPYTLFSFGGRRLKFKAPRCLRRYVRVKKWDDGYLEVDADYGAELGTVEEYIDLRPVLSSRLRDNIEFMAA